MTLNQYHGFSFQAFADPAPLAVGLSVERQSLYFDFGAFSAEIRAHECQSLLARAVSRGHAVQAGEILHATMLAMEAGVPSAWAINPPEFGRAICGADDEDVSQ